jgi:competence protein ComEC
MPGRQRLRGPFAALAVAVASCRSGAPPASATPAPAPRAAVAQVALCGSGRPLTVHFYDVGQGLAALVELPDGRRVLVDTGDNPRRADCEECARKHAHLIDRLRADLGGAPIDVLWITHPHSDHLGGAPDVLGAFKVGLYIDNGRDDDRGSVQRARRAADARGTPRSIVDPTHQGALRPTTTPDVRLTPIVPSSWPGSCAHDENECSIGLRIDYCSSSILFTGDAEHEEEARLDARPVTLLQVAHHGSETSTSPGFLARVRPSYAVISAGKPDEGMNHDYCHPRAVIVERLSRVLGGPPSGSLRGFDGERCDRARPSDWVDVPASGRLWATERDGDVVLSTAGDGVFVRR